MPPPVALPSADHLPLLAGDGTRRNTESSAAERATTDGVELVRLAAARIGSSTQLLQPYDSVTAHRIQEVLRPLTPIQLHTLQVLLGHAVTAVVQHKRGRERAAAQASG